MNNKMMTYAIAVSALAVIVLAGLAIVSQYGIELRTNTAGTVTGLTPLVDTNVAVGTTGQFPYLQSLTDCVNATGGQSLSSSFYTINEGTENGGTVKLLTSGVAFNNTAVNCSLTYKAENTLSNSADAFSAGLAIFGTFMVVITLSLVGKIIINIFKNKE